MGKKFYIKSRIKDICIALIFLAISIAIVFYIYEKTEKTKETLLVPVLKKDVKYGEIIDSKNIQLIEINGYGINNIVIEKENLIGKYAVEQLESKRIIFNDELSNKPVIIEEKLFEYAAVAVTTDLTKSVGKLPQKGDIVSAIINIDGEIIRHEELNKIKVIGIRNSKGEELKGLDTLSETNKNVIPAIIIFDATPIQQELLIEGEYKGEIHLVLLPNEEKKWKKL